MIKKICKKVILIFILGLVFCISTKNVNAVDFTVSVNPTGNRWTTGTDLRCTEEISWNVREITANNYGECNSFTNNAGVVYLRNIYLNRNIPAIENNYYSFFLGFQTPETLESITWNLNTTSDWTIFEFKEVTSDKMLDNCYSWTVGDANVPSVCQTYGRQWKSKYYQVTLKANRTGNLRVMLGNPDGNPRSFMVIPSFGGSQLSMSTIFEFEPGAMEQMNKKDDKDRNNIEEQSSTNETQANDEGDQATETGTSLFSAFTQLLGALTNVGGNSCTLPSMQVYSLNLGNMNLCTYSIPPQIMALVSIGMVFIIIPLGIHLVKKMIALYKEITG